MENNVTMKARDTVAAKLAECFITIGTRRYNFMQMIDMEAKIEKTKELFPVLRIIISLCCGRRFWTTRTPAMTFILRCRLPTTIPPVMQEDRQSSSMTATRMAVCWPNLTLTASIWTRRLKELLKISPCRNPLPDSQDF